MNKQMILSDLKRPPNTRTVVSFRLPQKCSSLTTPMSDYFSRNVSYGQNFYTNFCRHIGQTRDDSNICFNERGKGEYYKAYNHVHRDLPRVGMPRERREFSERLDFENLGRLSSNLVQFLSTARHNADKVSSIVCCYICPKVRKKCEM